MAPNVETVHQFLVDLAEPARQPALKEVAELKSIASANGIQRLTTFGYRLLLQKSSKSQQFNLSQKRLSPLPAPKILQGLFSIVNRLYGIQVVEREAPVWHPNARSFELEDQGTVIGGFLL